MKDILIGVLVATTLFASYQAWKWKKNADERGWKAEQAYAYLAEPILRLPDGRVLTRAQALDEIVRQAAEQGKK